MTISVLNDLAIARGDDPDPKSPMRFRGDDPDPKSPMQCRGDDPDPK